MVWDFLGQSTEEKLLIFLLLDSTLACLKKKKSPFTPIFALMYMLFTIYPKINLNISF